MSAKETQHEVGAIPNFNLALHDKLFGTRHCERLRCKVTDWPCAEMAASKIDGLADCDCWACRNWRRWDADRRERAARFSIPVLGLPSPKRASGF